MARNPRSTRTEPSCQGATMSTRSPLRRRRSARSAGWTMTTSRPVDAAKREWDKGELNRVWVGDITYLRTWEGWLYLATVIDAHSRRVIGWAIDEHMRADLVQDALVM